MTPAQSRARAAYGRGAETLPPGRQIVLLYDAATARLAEAGSAARDGRIEDRWRAVGKARTIVEALQGCLDFERGGAVAPLLDGLYAYFLRRMQDIDLRNDAAACDEIAARLGELRAAWSTIGEGSAVSSIAAGTVSV